MLIHLIRHGLTRNGSLRRYEGWTDSPLSAEGRAALRKADFEPELLFCSPLLRARETAALLFPGRTPVLIGDLREMDFGIFEGRSASDMEHDAAYRAWVDGNCLGRCPGGEDRRGFSGRVTKAFDRLMREAFENHAGEIAVVAHGGVQMAVMEARGVPLREYYRWQTACGEGLLLEADFGDAFDFDYTLRFLGTERSTR